MIAQSRPHKILLARVLYFPSVRSVGDLYIRSGGEKWSCTAIAQGEMQIPADIEVLLDFIGQEADLRYVRDGDIQWIHVTDHMAEFRIAPYIKHLPSVQVIHGANRDWMDHWLTLTKDLSNTLPILSWSTAIRDKMVCSAVMRGATRGRIVISTSSL